MEMHLQFTVNSEICHSHHLQCVCKQSLQITLVKQAPGEQEYQIITALFQLF